LAFVRRFPFVEKFAEKKAIGLGTIAMLVFSFTCMFSVLQVVLFVKLERTHVAILVRVVWQRLVEKKTRLFLVAVVALRTCRLLIGLAFLDLLWLRFTTRLTRR
jgi:hypothetical protein